ncbi:MAG: hypothetical protein ABW221_03930 [Vicinamibacteria bacterium]
MTDPAAELTTAFRNASPAVRHDLLRELAALTGPAVLTFLASVASDTTEADTTRVEAIRLLETRSLADDERRLVAHVLQSVVKFDRNEHVRARASTALDSFRDVPGIDP